jgi:hypothetical protein
MADPGQSPYADVLAKLPGVRDIEDVSDGIVTVRTVDGRRQQVDRATFDSLTDHALDLGVQVSDPMAGATAQVTPAVATPAASLREQGFAGVPNVEQRNAPQAPAVMPPSGTMQTRGDLDDDAATAPPVPGDPSGLYANTKRDMADPNAFSVEAPGAGGAPSVPGVPGGMDPNQVVFSSPSQVVPVGGTIQATSGVDLSAEQAQAAQGAEMQKAGLVDQAGVEAAGKAMAAKAMSDAADINNDFVARQQRAAAAGLEESRRIFAEVQEIQKELQTQKIDPNRVWGNKSTGGKIATAIGIILSGIGSGLTGGPNLAMQVIDGEIERDLDAQKANLDNKRAGLGDKINALAAARTITKDEVEQLDVSRLIMLDAIKAKLQSFALQTDSEVAQGRVMEAVGMIDQRSAEIAAGLKEKSTARVVSAMSMKRVGGQTVTAGQAAGQVDFAKGDKKLFVPQLQAFALSEEDAKAMKTTSEKVTEMRGVIRQINQLRDDGGSISPKNRARAEALARQLQLTEKTRQQLGALSGSDIEMLESYVPSNPLAILSYNAERLSDFDGQLAGTLPRMVEARGALPAYNVPSSLQRTPSGARDKADQEFQGM